MNRWLVTLWVVVTSVSLSHAAEPGVSLRADARPIDAIPSAPSIEERFLEIQRRVQAAVMYPPIARAREVTGLTQVEFAIDPEGRPDALRILGSSGNGLLDQAAAQAVRNAAPLPWVYGRVIVPVSFQLHDPD
ncbi:energy transducer TonB [Myxococcota bacterium]|nr:energy transducer TonB [Myxococcota bacterium]